MNILKKIYCRIFQKCFHVAIPLLPYREPELIRGFAGVPGVLAEKKISRVMLVTDPGVYGLGLTEPLEDLLKAAGIFVSVYKDTVANPTSANVEEARRQYLQDQCQGLIAFGGGSSMDCAKGIGARLARPGKSLARMEGILKVMRRLPLLIAIPTTAGTGSETTLAAVITDADTHHKYAINDFFLIPDYAVLEPEITAGLPPQLTATTGMDALTHAIEAYVSTLNCPFTDPLALQAIEMVLDYLPASYNLNMEAREQMHYAQCLAGMAFSNALLGIVHSMAHKTGAAFSTGHIPHGCANAIYLPYVIKYNAKDKVAASRYAEIARRMGLPGTSEKALINSLCAKIDEFNAKMNIPKTLKEFGINEEEFKEKLDKIAELAVGDACTGSNPRAIDPATMAKLFTCTYYGTEVDF